MFAFQPSSRIAEGNHPWNWPGVVAENQELDGLYTEEIWGGSNLIDYQCPKFRKGPRYSSEGVDGSLCLRGLDK